MNKIKLESKLKLREIYETTKKNACNNYIRDARHFYKDKK